MTKRPIPIEDMRIATVGDLKKERFFTLQELLKLEERMNGRMEDKFVTNERFEKYMTIIGTEFNRVHEAISNLGDLITREVSLLRDENREFRQRTAQLEKIDLINERKIDDLDGRVLKLETVS
jgi:hypothetical protein